MSRLVAFGEREPDTNGLGQDWMGASVNWKLLNEAADL